jgi:hypothetical protein
VKTCNDGPIISITAAAALVARRFIGFTGDLCGAAAKALGVSELATAITEQCPVRISGIAVVESGGILAIGDRVVSDSTGRAVKAGTFAAAAPAITYDATKVTIGADKLTIDSGATPMTSSAANGDVVTAAADAIAIAAGAVVPAAPVLSGSVLPQAINGTVLDVAGGAGEFVRVLLAA